MGIARTLPFLVALFSAAVLASGQRSGARAEVREVSLGEIQRSPARYLGEKVRFRLQFSRELERFDPFFSRFGPRSWAAVEAWPDESLLWDPEAFERRCSHLFVRRGRSPHEHFAAARRYRRFEVQGIVREIFHGEPWIEVRSVRALGNAVGEGTILHVVRAQGFLAEGRPDRARQQLERALAAPMPPQARRAIQSLLDGCPDPEQVSSTGG